MRKTRTSWNSSIVAAILGLYVLLGASCTSVPIVIEEGLETSELIQRAQEASDKRRPDRALQYYQAILDRYPNDLYATSAARYEIAFIYFKKGDHGQAKQGFEELLALYEGPEADLLPAQFRVLSEKILAKILTEAK